ncbi:MAG: hypothetical protein IJ437_05755 [Clostridia bacterium]|nr:hypothetical protein [Clostridia bacterium]
MYDFIDLHCHILSGIDDGAKDTEMMTRMLDIAYSDGIKTICLTPHFKIYRFNDAEEISKYNQDIQKAYELACCYAKNTYPDMTLLLGNEIMYHNDMFDSLVSSKCHTISTTSYVLVEFPPHISSFDLKNATSKLLRKGFHPIIAHVERYNALLNSHSLLKELKESGAIIQINSNSITRFKFGKVARFIRKALKNKLVDIVCTDSHNDTSFPPTLSKAYRKVCKRYGNDYSKKIFHDNQFMIINNKH